MSGYEPVGFRGFGGGLNLRDKEDAVDETECIDCLNVEYTTKGAVKQRAGYAKFTTSALTNAATSLRPYYTTAGTSQLLAGCGSRLEAISTSGAVVASSTGFGAGTIWSFARFGSPGNEVAYAGNGSTTLQKWNGTVWANVASTPNAGALAVMAVDQGNRLVAGRFNTTNGGPTGGASTSNPSRVYFSDPGAPETWGTNNYVDFSPGDGERVLNITAWREFVFIFKETKFFVVYGTSTDASGNPVFNYRTIDGGVGIANLTTAVLPDGVYFMGRRGVYRTTGSEAELISSPIDPIFLGSPSAFYNGGVLNHAQITKCAMGSHEQRVYLAFPSGTSTANDRVLVYDTVGDWWSLYDFPAAALASFRISDQAELVFAYSSGTNDLGRHSSSYTTDAVSSSNLVANGDFETNTTGWTGDTGTTVSRVTTEHAVGSASMKLVRDGSGTTTGAHADTAVSTGVTYTASAQLKGAGVTIAVQVQEYNGASLVGSTTSTPHLLTSSWQTVQVSRNPATGTTLRIFIYAIPGSTFYVDDVELVSGVAAVSSRWQSGWFDYDLTTEKTIRETKLWGSGKVFLSVAPDFDLQTATQDLVTFSETDAVDWNTGTWNTSTWGAGAAGLTEQLRRRAVRGTVFSTRFDNSVVAQTWAVHRLAHHLREQRVPSVSVN